MCTVRHYIISRTRHCWLKSKQSCLSQNTPKRCILHSNTHSDPLIKIPSKKSRNLFIHPENTHFRLWPVRVFPLYTAKNPPYYSQNKCLKTPHCKLSVLKLGKNTTFGSIRVCFPLHTLSKILSYFYPSFLFFSIIWLSFFPLSG